MASASIVIEQSGVAGAAGKSRDDIATGSPVTLRNANDEGVRSWRWKLEPPKGSTAALSNVTASAPIFTPDVDGTYVVSLAVNEGRTGETDKRLATVRNPTITIGAESFDTRYIGIGEDGEANWTVDLGAGPVTNTTGWWEDLDRWQRLIQAAAGVAGTGEANTGSNLGGGTGVFSAKVGVDLQFKTLTSGDASVTFTPSATEIDVRAAASGALVGLPGNITEDLILYVDPGDRNSYTGSGATVVDLSGAGLATSGTLGDAGSGTPPTWDDGNFRFNPGSRDNYLTFSKSGALDDLFDTGGTLFVWARMDGWVGSSPNEAVLASTASGLSFVNGNATAEILDGWCLSIQEQVTGNYDPAVLFSQSFATGRNRYQTTRDVSDTDKTPVGTGSTVSGVSPYRTGRWVCIAITYDASDLANDPTVYIDGLPRVVYANDYGGLNQANTATVGPFSSDAGNDLYIGNVLATTVQYSFLGSIGPVLAFNRVLNGGEISRVYNVFASRYGMGVHALDATNPGGSSSTRRFGTNLVLSGGTAAAAPNSNGTEGGNVVIRGSRGTDNSANDPFSDSGASEAPAGSVFIAGGDLGADPNSTGPKLSTGDGGNVQIRGGYGADGGTVTIEAGKRSSTAPSNQDTLTLLGGESAYIANLDTAGGSVRLQGGSCGQSAVNKLAGDVTIQGGFNCGTSGGAFTGGNVSILSGGRAANGIGNARGDSGDIVLSTDAANGIPATPSSNQTGTGSISIDTSGAPSNTSGIGGNTGDVTLRTGDGRLPGSVSVRAGDVLASGSGGTGGGITLRAGDAWDNAAATNNGGTVSIQAGDANNGTAATAGGDVTVSAGNTGSATADAGDVTITGGTALGSGQGGSIALNVGGSVSGSSGSIIAGGPFFQNAAGMKFGTVTPGAVSSGTIVFATGFSATPRMVQLTVEGSIVPVVVVSVTSGQINWATTVALLLTDKIHWMALL